MDNDSLNFKYSLKVSARARHVRLAIKPYRGLEVVIPKKFPRNQIPRILQQHEAWITTQLEKHRHSLKPARLPDHVFLGIIDTRYAIRYETSKRSGFEERHEQLIVYYDTHHPAVNQLRTWIRASAKNILPQRLESVADKFGFDFKKCIIRSQKSRWGSCSSAGTISLNDQLLFLPEETVDYLMIHELCHTRHMNHSGKFWQLVGQCCPDYKLHEHILSERKDRVPDWFLESLYSG